MLAVMLLLLFKLWLVVVRILFATVMALLYVDVVIALVVVL